MEPENPNPSSAPGSSSDPNPSAAPDPASNPAWEKFGEPGNTVIDPADPTDYGYRMVAVLPVQARRNYAVLSLMAALYIYWMAFLIVLVDVVVIDVVDSLRFLFNEYWVLILNLAAVVASGVTLYEHRAMRLKGWLPCNRYGLPLGRAAAWTGLVFALAQSVLIINALTQPDVTMDFQRTWF